MVGYHGCLLCCAGMRAPAWQPHTYPQAHLLVMSLTALNNTSVHTLNPTLIHSPCTCTQIKRLLFDTAVSFVNMFPDVSFMCTEGFGSRHIVGQKSNLSPLGNEVYFHAKMFQPDNVSLHYLHMALSSVYNHTKNTQAPKGL